MTEEPESDARNVAMAIAIGITLMIAISGLVISLTNLNSQKFAWGVANFNCTEYEIEKQAGEQGSSPFSIITSTATPNIYTMNSSSNLMMPWTLKTPKRQFDCRADLSAR